MNLTPNTDRSSEEDFYQRVRFKGHPQADLANIMTLGEVRFTLLTPCLVRLEWAEGAAFEDRSTYAFPSRNGSPIPHQANLQNGWLTIQTSHLHLRYRAGSGCFTTDNLSITMKINNQDVIWRPGTPDPGNLRGTRRTLDGCAGDAALGEGLLSRAGWSLVDDTNSVVFDTDGWVTTRPEHALQDWYFFGYGHAYQQAISDYTQFGGAIPLIPRFVLGAWWSRYWAYSDEDLKELVKGFEDHHLPLDVLVIDMDWHTPHAWTGYTWNRELFPDPEGFLAWVHQKGLRATLNLHPAEGVQAFEAIYPTFARAMDIDPTTKAAIPFRITDKKFVKHYFELLHHSMEAQGVDFWWIDWQQGEISELRGLDPLPWINHLHYTDLTRKGQRPLLYSRWGGLGNHRYQIGFSGDTIVVWQALQFQPYMTATAANVCYGWWTHDIGGHMGGSTDPELYARWVQFGALSPCLRLHSTKDARAERRPWAYPPEVFKAARDAFHLRYQLLPYLYTMARRAHDSGIALCRPMYFDYPEDDSAYVARYQYAFGSQLIAAPIVFPADPASGMAVTDVWVPDGRWFDYQTKESYTGPGWIHITGDINRLPLLVKSGGILPLAIFAENDPDSDTLKSGNISSIQRDQLVLSIFPGEAGSFDLYEDDGASMEFQAGVHEWTHITTAMPDSHTWEVEIAALMGDCPLLPKARSYEIRLEGSRPPTHVTLNGVPAAWEYQTQELRTSIKVPLTSNKQVIRLRVGSGENLDATGEVHNLACTLQDCVRLLGSVASDIFTSREAGITHIMQMEPVNLDALARLGGPLVRFIEYATPEEISVQLGHIIIGSPIVSEATFDLVMEFSLVKDGKINKHQMSLPSCRQSQVIAVPFSHSGAPVTQQWTADVWINWHGKRLHTHHQAMPLFPAISDWQVAIVGSESTVSVNNVLHQGKLSTVLNWVDYRQNSEKVENASTLFWLSLFQQYQGSGQPAGASAYLAARIHSIISQTVNLVFACNAAADFWINGQPYDAIGQSSDDEPYPFAKGMGQIIYHANHINLVSGDNYLLVKIAPSEPGWVQWHAAGVLQDENGCVPTGINYREFEDNKNS